MKRFRENASTIDERPVNKCRRLKDRENENREGEVLDSISTSASQTHMRGQKKKTERSAS